MVINDIQTLNGMFSRLEDLCKFNNSLSECASKGKIIKHTI